MIAFCSSAAAIAQKAWYDDPANPLVSSDVSLVSPSVLYDTGRHLYIMWYTDGRHVLRATSPDGRVWTRGDADGRSIAGTAAVPAIHSLSVVAAEGGYVMYYAGSHGPEGPSVYRATSPDGIGWASKDSLPAIAPGAEGTWDSRGVQSPTVLRRDGEYLMWYAGTDGTLMRTGLATSADGIRWTKSEGNPVLREGASKAVDARGATVAGVTWSGDGYRMAYVAEGPTGATRIVLASSSDGTRWRKGTAFLVPGERQEWSRTDVGGGTFMFHEGHHHFWYAASGPDGISRIGYTTTNEEIVIGPPQH